MHTMVLIAIVMQIERLRARCGRTEYPHRRVLEVSPPIPDLCLDVLLPSNWQEGGGSALAPGQRTYLFWRYLHVILTSGTAGSSTRAMPMVSAVFVYFRREAERMQCTTLHGHVCSEGDTPCFACAPRTCDK